MLGGRIHVQMEKMWQISCLNFLSCSIEFKYFFVLFLNMCVKMTNTGNAASKHDVFIKMFWMWAEAFLIDHRF